VKSTRVQLERFVKDAVILLVSMVITEPMLTPNQVKRVSALQIRGRRLLGEKLPPRPRKNR
jgi:hypothetical protein